MRLVTAAAVLLSGPRVDSRDSAHLVRARARAALRARTRARTRARARVRARARATVQPAPLRPERGGQGEVTEAQRQVEADELGEVLHAVPG